MSQTLTFDRWILWGSGWETSYQAKVTISVSRSYGSDVATVSGTAQMSSYGGDTNTTWTFWIKIGSTWYSKTLPTGTHWAGDWYSTNFSWDISVGATAGSLGGQVTFQAKDVGGAEAYSTYKDWSQSYGSKGASSITSATNVTLSTSGTVNSSVSWTAYSNTFTYVLSASLGGYSASATYSSLSGNVTKTLGFSSSFINAITTSKSATCTITLTTKSGSTVIGTSTKNITLTVPSGINPSVSISTQMVSALSSTYFANKYCTLLDKIKVTLSETTQYGSAIASRSITANGETGSVSPWTSSALQNYGANTVTARITDGRSNSGTASTSVNVYWYFYPTVSVKYRHGTDYYLDITGRIAYVGGDQTTKQLRLSIYKGTTQIVSNLNLDSFIASSPSGGTYDGYLDITGTYTIPAEYITDIATETYDFRLTVTDTVSSATAKAYSGIAVMTFGAGGTGITAHKPLSFDYPTGYLRLNGGTLDSTVNLDDIHYTRYGWCDNVQGRPPIGGTYGYFLGFENFQFYLEFVGAVGWRLYARGYVNNQWYPWAGNHPYDFSSQCTYNLSYGTGFIKAYYYPMEQTVKLTFAVYNATSNRFAAGDTGAPFTIPSTFRPKSNKGNLPIMVKGNTGVWDASSGTVYVNGKVGQNQTANAAEMYGTVEYSLLA